MAIDVTRRELVVGGAAVVGCMAVALLVSRQEADVAVLRPPGAVAEPGFSAACIRCYRCISVCPADVLEPMPLEAGILQVRTPRLSFANDACTFCDLCRQVCPTGVIGGIDPYHPENGRIGLAVLHQDRCLAFTDNSCGICVDACPYEALGFDAGRRPVVDEARCNGCGICVKICPANVLRSFGGGTTRGIEVVADNRVGNAG
jgi:ferredoxin-type protein NapG